jgi:tripartite-type tricarboxylate transporter receptor subunit TctC
MQDLVAGQIDTMFVNPGTALSHVRAGSVKAFAVTAKSRLAIAADIPTFDEMGLGALRFSLWAALFAPKGTPKEIIDRLNAAAVSALGDTPVREKLAAQGFQIPPREQQTPEALAALQKADIEKWWPVIKAAGIKGE